MDIISSRYFNASFCGRSCTNSGFEWNWFPVCMCTNEFYYKLHRGWSPTIASISFTSYYYKVGCFIFIRLVRCCFLSQNVTFIVKSNFIDFLIFAVGSLDHSLEFNTVLEVCSWDHCWHIFITSFKPAFIPVVQKLLEAALAVCIYQLGNNATLFRRII